MARTLNELLRKGKRKSSSSAGSNSQDTSRMKLSDFRNRRKSELQRWMQPLYRKSKNSSPSAVIIDDSSDDDGTTPKNVLNLQEESSSTASHSSGSSSAVANAATAIATTATATATSTATPNDGNSKATAIDLEEPTITNSVEESRERRSGRKSQILDIQYSGASGSSRCKGPDCRHVSVRGTTYCNLHEGYDELKSESSDSESSSSEEEEDSEVEVEVEVEADVEVEIEDDDDDDDDDDSVQIVGVQPAKPIQCQAVTGKGRQCSIMALGVQFCSIHMRVRNNGTVNDVQEKEEGVEQEKSEAEESKDRFFRGNPGTKRCYALTQRNRKCSYAACQGTDFCNSHRREEVKEEVKKEVKKEEEPEEELKDAELHSDESANRIFRGDPRTRQCDAVTTRNRKCLYLACRGNDFCRLHIHVPPKSIAQPPSSVRVFTGIEGERKCLGAFKTGKTCYYEATQNNEYCIKHQEQADEFDFEASVRKEEQDATSSKHDYVGSEDTKPSKHDSEGSDLGLADCTKDQKYTRTKGIERCIHISGNSTLCVSQAVNDTVYCYKHAHYNEELSPVSKPAGDDDSDSSDSSRSAYTKESDSESEAVDDNVLRPYKHKEFLEMWRECEEYCGEMTDEIENTRRVRGANQAMAPEDTDGQQKAQYGRLLPRAMKTMIKDILRLSRNDVFLDIGHGIGNTCIQAAFTIGCESRGIEVVYGRNSIAEVFRDNLVAQNRDNKKSRVTGEVILRHGRLEDESHRKFLTEGVTRAYVNNFNGVFAERSSKINQKWFLDDYVAALFAMMTPGAIMVTLHPLNLGPTKDEANNMRKKQGLSVSDNASFYEVEKVLLGKACDTVKWNQHSGNQKKIYIYKYTRVAQPAGEDVVFLCSNPRCDFAKREVIIKATTTNEEGRCVMNHCECKVTAKNLRRQRRKRYTDF